MASAFSRASSLVIFGIPLLLVLSAACRPPNQNMLVVNVQGDIFLPKLRASRWNVGQAELCEIASRGSIPPDARGDLLLCGEATRLAWSQTWLRSDIKTQIYGDAQTRMVRFHGIGHDGGRGRSPLWTCSRSEIGIDCE